MRQGEHGSEMFIVAKGRFTIERNGLFLREVGPGTSLGDMSLLAEGPRTATVIAAEPSRILLAGHREFHTLMNEHPTIRMHILEGLAIKVRLLDEAGVH
jgi:CRP-like cAMP-binding protein